MADSKISTGFVDLNNLTTEVLYAIDDQEKKKYYRLALQRVINAIRNMNVSYSPNYEELPVVIEGDLRIVKYPIDLVKVVSVGIYNNGKWFSFTREPEAARTTSADGEKYDEEIGEGKKIPRQGFRFGARGFNIGYWVEDDLNRRLFVRNYEKDNVILKYRGNGVNCSTKTCVPYQMKDLIISMVVYQFAMSRVPFRHSAAELELKLRERSRHYDEYTALEYEPQNMSEMKDSQWGSFNSTVRR